MQKIGLFYASSTGNTQRFDLNEQRTKAWIEQIRPFFKSPVENLLQRSSMNIE